MTQFIAICCRLTLIAACAVFGLAAVLLIAQFPVALFGLLLLLAWRGQKWRVGGWSHGTAAFGNLLTFYKNGFFREGGLLIGTGGYAAPPNRWQSVALLFSPFLASRTAVLLFLAAWCRGKWGAQIPLRLHDYTHIGVFGATGRGKGVGLVVPTLLSYPGSMVVVDQKDGELFKLTGEARRKFGRVIRVDGFGVCGPGSIAFNPVSELDPDADDFHDACVDLANMNIVRTGREHDGQHFLDMAQNDLASVTAFVRSCEPNAAKRNLQTIRDIISNPDRFKEVIELMSAIEPLSRQAHQMRWPRERERGSIMSTLTRMTAWLDGAAIRAHTGVALGFNPMWLRTPGTTVYFCGDSQRTNGTSLMRLYLGWTLRKLCANGGDPTRPVLFLIDEAGNLGAIDALDRATTMVRSAGINLFFVWQSLGQVKEHYGERATTILENIDCQIYLGIKAVDSAETVSKMAGDQTIGVESYNETEQRSRPDGYGRDSGSGSTSKSTSKTTTEIGRNLIRMDEVLRMPADAALVFTRNLSALPVQLIRYYASPLFKGGRRGETRGLGFSAVSMTLAAAVFSGLMSVVLVSLALAPGPVPVQRAPFPSYGNSPRYGPSSVPYSGPRRPSYLPPRTSPYPQPVRRQWSPRSAPFCL